MAFDRSRRQAKDGLGTAILFTFFAIAGGGFLAATMDSASPSARVYLAEDLPVR
jgi:hypothetical protein